MSSPRSTFFQYLGRYRLQLAIGALFATGNAFVAVIPPRYVGQIVDELGRGSSLEIVVRLALVMVAFSALEQSLRGVMRYAFLDTERRIEYDIRNDLFAHLQRMHLGYFQHQRIGDLMARLTNDLAAVRMMAGRAVMNVFLTTTLLFFAVSSMLAISVKLTVIAGILLPFISLAFWWIGRRVQARFEELQAQFGELSTEAQENFSGIRVVKAFAQEHSEIQSFASVNDEYVRRAVGVARLNGLVWPSMSLVLGLAVLSALYVGGGDAIRGALTVGTLVQFVAYLYLLSWPMISIGWVSNLFQQGWASLRRLQEIFDAKPQITDPTDAVTTPIRGEVEFRAVSFAYDAASERGRGAGGDGAEGASPRPGQTTVLHDVSFRVPAGGSLAIVGPTGSGKSTLVNLVPRLFDPQQGRVLVDGVDVRRYPLAALRAAIGYVPQETFLFSVPLRENVGFGADVALPEERLEWAGDVSQLNQDVADFPARYDTIIGERGVTLSGGQKQRTAIARAIAKDPRVVILDDALSAVDTYTEAEILKRLRGVLRERTSIVVAHRISTVKDADEILVLDDGRIVERGAHGELLELGGLYARMYRRQLLEEELEVDIERVEHERRLVSAQDADPLVRRRAPGIEEVPEE